MQVDAMPNETLPTIEDAETDIAAMILALGLQSIRRYMDQKHWTAESTLARAADLAEPGLKLEIVAAHSWHECGRWLNNQTENSGKPFRR